MKRKPIVGETLYLRRIHRGGDKIPLSPVTVFKVGRRYFTIKIEDWNEVQFEIDTWVQSSKWNPDYVLYETEQEYLNTIERSRILSILRYEFGSFGDTLLPFETLRQIRDLVAQAKKQNT